MSDHQTPRGAGPGQPAPYDQSSVRTAKVIATIGMVVAVIALIIAGALYIRVKSVVLDHTDELTQKVETVAQNNDKAVERMANINSEINTLKSEVGKLESRIPGIVQNKMVLHSLSDMKHKADFLAGNIKDEAKREKVVQIVALLAELQERKPAKKAAESAAKEPAKAAPAKKEAEKPAARAEEPETAEIEEEDMGTPPLAHELAQAEEHATAGQAKVVRKESEKEAEKPAKDKEKPAAKPEKKTDAEKTEKAKPAADKAEEKPQAKAEADKGAKSEEKPQAKAEADKDAKAEKKPATGDELEAEAEAKAYQVDEQAAKKTSEAVKRLDEAADKLKDFVEGYKADTVKKAEPKDKTTFTGDKLEAKAESKAYQVDDAAAKDIPKDVHNLVNRLHDTFHKLEDFVSGGKTSPSKQESKGATKPEADAKAKPEAEGKAKPADKEAKGTVVDPLVEQLKKAKI